MTTENNNFTSVPLSTQGYEGRAVIYIDILGFKDFVEKNSDIKIKEFFAFFEKEVKAKIKWRWLANYFNDYTKILFKHHGNKIKLVTV